MPNTAKLMNIQDSRILIKRSTTAGVVPTIPASSDHTDGSWLVTDIYKGELFINLADGIAYTRDDSGIIVINQSISSFGAWDATVAYSVGMTVYRSGLIWFANGASTNEIPGTGSNWTLLITNTSAYSASGWNGSLYSPTQDAVRDLVETGLFKQSGNSFTADASIGTNDAFDLLFRAGNANRGGVTDTAEWMFGVTTPFASTHKSNKSLGNTSGSVAEWWKNSDNDTNMKLFDNGVLHVENDLRVLDATGFQIGDYASSGGYQRITHDSGTFFFLTAGNTGATCNYGGLALSDSFPVSVGAGYQYVKYGVGVGTSQDATVSMKVKKDANSATEFIAQFLKASDEMVMEVRSDKNIGINGNSYGSGLGVMFIGDAGTDASGNPTGGAILQSKSGRLRVMETDGSLSYLVKSTASTKTTAAAPYTNDGYVEVVINGTTVKLMTTA